MNLNNGEKCLLLIHKKIRNECKIKINDSSEHNATNSYCFVKHLCQSVGETINFTDEQYCDRLNRNLSNRENPNANRSCRQDFATVTPARSKFSSVRELKIVSFYVCYLNRLIGKRISYRFAKCTLSLFSAILFTTERDSHQAKEVTHLKLDHCYRFGWLHCCPNHCF